MWVLVQLSKCVASYPCEVLVCFLAGQTITPALSTVTVKEAPVDAPIRVTIHLTVPLYGPVQVSPSSRPFQPGKPRFNNNFNSYVLLISSMRPSQLAFVNIQH